jgi:hypothetical protein
MLDLALSLAARAALALLGGGGGGGGGSTAALKFNVAGNSQYAPVVAL